MKKDKKDIFDPEFNNNEKPSLNSNDFTPASSNNKDNFAMENDNKENCNKNRENLEKKLEKHNMKKEKNSL